MRKGRFPGHHGHAPGTSVNGERVGDLAPRSRAVFLAAPRVVAEAAARWRSETRLHGALLDPEPRFRESHLFMSAPRWHVRIIALLQLVVVLPSMVSGSICISSDGRMGPEFGYCACTGAGLGTAEATIGAAGTPDCGPCRDQAFSAVRGGRPSSTYIPVTASPLLASSPVVLASPIAESQVFWVGEPPGTRLPILRC